MDSKEENMVEMLARFLKENPEEAEKLAKEISDMNIDGPTASEFIESGFGFGCNCCKDTLSLRKELEEAKAKIAELEKEVQIKQTAIDALLDHEF